jgi:FtsH-binding integral membrane protein
MGMRSDSGYGQTISVSPTQQIAMSRFVTRTYGWMFLGLLITGFVSLGIVSSEAAVQTIMQNRAILFGALIAEFVLVMGLTAASQRLSAATATLGFLAYSALNGVTFSTIFMVYTMSSVAQVFFITAGMFGGLALYGSVTKKDLTGVGSFVGMGLWGLILCGFVNMFMRSEALSMGLGVFAGLTAYDAQKIRAMAYQSTLGGTRSDSDKGAVFGALMLYLNFINLFLSLLRLFGNRRD